MPNRPKPSKWLQIALKSKPGDRVVVPSSYKARELTKALRQLGYWCEHRKIQISKPDRAAWLCVNVGSPEPTLLPICTACRDGRCSYCQRGQVPGQKAAPIACDCNHADAPFVGFSYNRRLICTS